MIINLELGAKETAVIKDQRLRTGVASVMTEIETEIGTATVTEKTEMEAAVLDRVVITAILVGSAIARKTDRVQTQNVNVTL